MMKDDQWLTPEAKEALDTWLKRNQITWASEGADPTEIRSDLEAHLYQEREGDEKVSVDRVREAIDSMGLPSLEMELPPVVPLNFQVPQEKKSGCLMSCKDWFFGLLGNVKFLAVWSAAVVLWELVFGTLAGMFFDPMARLAQIIVLLILVVFGLVSAHSRFQKEAPEWMIFLRGVGALIAAYWGVLLLPVLVVGSLMYGAGVVYSFGIGLLFFPIFLLCAMTAAAPLCAMYGFLKAGEFRTYSKTGGLGMLLGLVILVFVEGPSFVTRYAVSKEDPQLIRMMGSEHTLLSMCKEGGTNFDTTGHLLGFHRMNIFGSGVSRFTQGDELQKRREIYYRVTGTAFNDTSGGRGSWMRGRRGNHMVGFDQGLGGDSVSSQVRGLELAGSRLDAHVDAASRLGYFEWTMDFSNATPQNQEARMQLLLPNNGVVSRLTLWVNGEPQEAAFASKKKVTEAYQSIAVRERRDPVLVRWVGSDRVMVQCFPVLPTENMRIRVGMTAPLDDEGRLFVPRLIEKNFEVPDDLKTTVWLQGDSEMEMLGLNAKGERGQWRETHGQITARDLMERHSHVKCELPDPVAMVWTEDQFASEGEKFLIRERVENPAKARSQKIVLVVDGSSYFSKWAEATDEAIACLQNRGHEVVVVLAQKENEFVTDQPVAGFEHLGGQNCIPALRLGLSKAQEIKADHLIWLHGSQPIVFGEEEGFLQLLERGFFQVAFSTIDLAGKPNRLVETVSKRVEMAGSARPAGPDDLMDSLHRLLLDENANYRWRRQATEPEEGQKVWDHLARFHVWEQVQEMSRSGKRRDELTELAARYQLVSQVSGAVVLETAEQYRRFGLEQVDVETAPEVPGIPEPSTALLSILSVVMVWRRKRHFS